MPNAVKSPICDYLLIVKLKEVFTTPKPLTIMYNLVYKWTEDQIEDTFHYLVDIGQIKENPDLDSNYELST